jgi:hypothetical protein
MRGMEGRWEKRENSIDVRMSMDGREKGSN